MGDIEDWKKEQISKLVIDKGDYYEMIISDPPLAEPIKMSKKIKDYWGSTRGLYFYEMHSMFRNYNTMATETKKRKDFNGEMLFLDIGANTGNYCFLTYYNPKIKCIAFEPGEVVYEILQENIKINNLENQIKAYNVALWSKTECRKLKIAKDGKDSGLSTLAPNPKRFNSDGFYEQKVKCWSLDDFLAANEGILGNNVISGCKIDTEGAELDILKGAQETLKKYKPFLIIEYDQKNTKQFGYDKRDIIRFLASIGYTEFTLSEFDGEIDGELMAWFKEEE